MATPTPESPQLGAAAPLAEAIAIMARLRAPDGCPWDREQTFDSIKRHTLEETYEVFDAIERRAWPDLKDELGDLLLQVLFYAQMASEAGYFTLQDVASNLNAKLIRRHPHIFGDVVAPSSTDVLRNWEQIKQSEKKDVASSQSSMLDDIPRTMPALMEAGKLGSRAAKVGFDWPNLQPVFEKLKEEIAEFEEVALIFAERSGLVAEADIAHLVARCDASAVDLALAEAVQPTIHAAAPPKPARKKSTVVSLIKHKMKKAAGAPAAHRARHRA